MKSPVGAFVVVGAMGFALQLTVLTLLMTVAHWRYDVATVVAVELTILHNFWWHERWTWRDRSLTSGVGARLARFHAGAGGVSMVSNVALAILFVESLHQTTIVASLAAPMLTGLANFLLADRWVFREAKIDATN